MSRLWYKQPAWIFNWEEALPVGNGRLGGMVFGRTDYERIQLNEESIWYGKPIDRTNPDALKNLDKVRELIFEGELEKAEKLMTTAFSGCPNTQRTYQTLGDLYIISDLDKELECKDYMRELDLDNAICRVSFTQGDVLYSREVFVSKPEDCMVIRLSSDKKGMISLCARLERDRFLDGVKKLSENTISLYGNLGEGATHFVTVLKAISKGGSISVTGEHICIEGADEAILYLTTCTDFYDIKSGVTTHGTGALIYDKLSEEAATILQKAIMDDYEEIKKRHCEDYHSLYGKVSLQLGSEAFDKLPTNERLKAAKKDIGLSKLLFDYGRFLLISCSRKGGLPANLQGIWNKEYLPPWDSKYTVNINAEMNYWPAETCGLSECHETLLDFIGTLVKNGRQTARKMYGCRGWVMHHNTDAFGDTNPQDICITASYWVMGAAWMCTHYWAHYEYTCDKEFLKKVFPVMLEAALFFLDFMVEKDGFLVVCPTVSPENSYRLPNGHKGAVSYGVTMDNQILRDLFSQCIRAGEILKETDFSKQLSEMEYSKSLQDLLGEIKEACDRLAPTRVGSDGRIMEWLEEYEECEPGHRHMSHLYGLFPSRQISFDKTPLLAGAARKTLEARLRSGGGHTGWSRAWIINFYARLHDGDEAYHNIEQMLDISTYTNLFDKHPPFQIDGNFGVVSGIAEMLLQSDEDTICLLPALPTAWKDGRVEGLRVVGGGTVSMEWKDGHLCYCQLDATNPMKRIMRYGNTSKEVVLEAGKMHILFSE
ncbi:glycoside hydrolase family 95 protein [Butyrivibrio sp. VCD2006]|uniref:glycoside hydrolase family 95 protein n=1 Tax=Butyrivibrio sp. VCD2006 TaxID=1280664 RepID=UPI000419B2D5|nr:glycoside hydrolase family 95 protein [Butyrivibrio sp. VCD2006]